MVNETGGGPKDGVGCGYDGSWRGEVGVCFVDLGDAIELWGLWLFGGVVKKFVEVFVVCLNFIFKVYQYVYILDLSFYAFYVGRWICVC